MSLVFSTVKNLSIADCVKAAGVVGAGGAGFPTHVKVASRVDFYIVNGAECEPLLRADRYLLAEQPARVVKTLETLVRTTGAICGIIALKSKYEDAIRALSPYVRGPHVRIQELPDVYPIGDEHILVKEVTGRTIPQGGIPLSVGVVVNNVQTLLNISHAVEGKPVTHKFVTITGDVRSPITCAVPVGMKVSEVLELAGGPATSNFVILDGGPMMGSVVTDPDHVVTKTTSALVVIPQDHTYVQKSMMSPEQVHRRARSACIQCTYCTEFCPRRLLGHAVRPHMVMRATAWGLKYHDHTLLDSLYCCECGLCQFYACPMHLAPRDIIRCEKSRLLAKGFKLMQLGQTDPPSFAMGRRVPLKRLIQRLGLGTYDHAAPLCSLTIRPQKVRIPVKQHIGAPSVPMVKVGQYVREGTPIAEIPEKALGARVHASIDGVVTAIGNSIVIENR